MDIIDKVLAAFDPRHAKAMEQEKETAADLSSGQAAKTTAQNKDTKSHEKRKGRIQN